jgi:hypothetical protein
MLKRFPKVMTIATVATMAIGGSVFAAGLKLVDKIDVGGKLDNFDIMYVDEAGGRMYFADRTNASVDIFDTVNNKFIGRVGGFVGTKPKSADSGPDGVVFIPETNEVWAGDGDSTVKVIDVKSNPPKVVATINTGGKHRVDEMDYDPKDGVILVANNADEPAFVTLISVKDRKILNKTELKEASDGIEQPAYVPETGMFYFSVPQLHEQKTKGAVGVYDPKAQKLVKMIPVDDCNPTGLWHGPGKKLIVGCSAGAPKGGMKPATMILDVGTEKYKVISEVGGEDMVYYAGGGLNQYYTASRDMPPGGVLGVIDAVTEKWIENIPTTSGSHAVGADGKTKKVFVALNPGTECPNGCVAVYAPK